MPSKSLFSFSQSCLALVWFFLALLAVVLSSHSSRGRLFCYVFVFLWMLTSSHHTVIMLVMLCRFVVSCPSAVPYSSSSLPGRSPSLSCPVRLLVLFLVPQSSCPPPPRVLNQALVNAPTAHVLTLIRESTSPAATCAGSRPSIAKSSSTMAKLPGVSPRLWSLRSRECFRSPPCLSLDMLGRLILLYSPKICGNCLTKDNPPHLNLMLDPNSPMGRYFSRP